MRPDRVVVIAPLFNQHFRLLERVEDLTGEQLVAELAVEALAVTVLPRRARLDEERLHTDALQPLAHDPSRELRPVVRPDVLRHAARDEQPGQSLEYVVALERASDVVGNRCVSGGAEAACCRSLLTSEHRAAWKRSQAGWVVDLPFLSGVR